RATHKAVPLVSWHAVAQQCMSEIVVDTRQLVRLKGLLIDRAELFPCGSGLARLPQAAGLFVGSRIREAGLVAESTVSISQIAVDGAHVLPLASGVACPVLHQAQERPAESGIRMATHVLQSAGHFGLTLRLVAGEN